MNREDVATILGLPTKALLAVCALLILACGASATGAFYVGVEITKYRANQDRNNKQLSAMETKVGALSDAVLGMEGRVTVAVETKLSKGVIYECEATPTRGRFKNCTRKKQE